MIKDGQDGGPVIGAKRDHLGVYPGEITKNVDGTVDTSNGGMSVNSVVKRLPLSKLPARLQDFAGVNEKYTGAFNPKTELYALEGVEYASVPISAELNLVPQKRSHGVIEPSRRMLLTDYEDALAATRERWVASDPTE